MHCGLLPKPPVPTILALALTTAPFLRILVARCFFLSPFCSIFFPHLLPASTNSLPLFNNFLACAIMRCPNFTIFLPRDFSLGPLLWLSISHTCTHLTCFRTWQSVSCFSELVLMPVRHTVSLRTLHSAIPNLRFPQKGDAFEFFLKWFAAS